MRKSNGKVRKEQHEDLMFVLRQLILFNRH